MPNVNDLQYGGQQLPYQTHPKSNKKAIIGLSIGVGVLLIGVIVLLILLLTGKGDKSTGGAASDSKTVSDIAVVSGRGANSPQQVMEKFINAVNNKDADALTKLFSSEFISAMKKNGKSENDLKEDCESEIKRWSSEMINASYIKIEQIDKEDVSRLQKYGNDYYNSVKEVVNIYYNLNNHERSFRLVKIGDKWYFDIA